MQILFLTIFGLTALVSLGGILKIRPFHLIEPTYVKKLFYGLLLQLVAVVLVAGKAAFSEDSQIDHYRWQISYPQDLKSRFEKPEFSNPEFKSFYQKHEFKQLGTISDNSLPPVKLDEYIDKIFMLRKAAKFANRTVQGDVYIKRKGNGDGPGHGKAILIFPQEIQPIAFNVDTKSWSESSWNVKFRQPDRYVKYEGRINTWPGGDLEVNFKHKQLNNKWVGNFNYNGVDVGEFSLEKL